MSNVEVIELSLIIDDNNTVSFKLDLNQADESAINSICEEIQEKYALSDKAKFRLNQHINNEVAKIKAKINSSKSPMFRSNDNIHNNHNIIDRLYYQGTKDKIEKYVRILEDIMVFPYLDPTLPTSTGLELGHKLGDLYPFTWNDPKTRDFLVPERSYFE